MRYKTYPWMFGQFVFEAIKGGLFDSERLFQAFWIDL